MLSLLLGLTVWLTPETASLSIVIFTGVIDLINIAVGFAIAKRIKKWEDY